MSWCAYPYPCPTGAKQVKSDSQKRWEKRPPNWAGFCAPCATFPLFILTTPWHQFYADHYRISFSHYDWANDRLPNFLWVISCYVVCADGIDTVDHYPPFPKK